MSDEPPALEQWYAMQARCAELTEALRSVLELVNRGEYRTHAQQLVLRSAEAMLKP